MHTQKHKPAPIKSTIRLASLTELPSLRSTHLQPLRIVKFMDYLFVVDFSLSHCNYFPFIEFWSILKSKFGEERNQQ